MESSKRRRIVIADDHPDALDQAARLLAPHYHIVGTVTNGLDLLDAAVRLAPDVILVDVAMPVLDGFEAAERLRASGYRGKLVFFSVWQDPDYVERAIALGGSGYVLKARLASDLVAAVEAALAGRGYLSPQAEGDVKKVSGRNHG